MKKSRLIDRLAMDEAKSMAQQQQQQQQHLMLQQQQQQQQQMILLQQQIQQQQKKQQQAISRFPSNIDAHLRPASSYRTPPTTTNTTNTSQSHTPITNPNPNPNSNLIQSNPNQQMQQQQQQQANRTAPPPAAELQMAYQDLWRVCHPDHKRPFSSIEDACQRYLITPYYLITVLLGFILYVCLCHTPPFPIFLT